MPRTSRRSIGGEVYHVLNRAALRYRMFRGPKDFAAFEQLIYEAAQRLPAVRVLAWCIMPTHWHLVLWPRRDGELSKFMFWLTMTHAARYRTSHQTVGYGPLYQGRFKSFPIERDSYLMTALRYVERNALRAGLADRAEKWRWSSLWTSVSGSPEQKQILHPWPLPRPENWVALVNRPQTVAEQEAMLTSIARNRPLGPPAWQRRMAERLGLVSCFRPGGRPKKKERSPA